jgi:hypothetical protein
MTLPSVFDGFGWWGKARRGADLSLRRQSVVFPRFAICDSAVPRENREA